MDNEDDCKTFFGNTLCILEEKQQSSLTEWCSAPENNSKLESQRQRSVPSATEEYNLLDDGGDTVFNQQVSFSFCWKRCLNMHYIITTHFLLLPMFSKDITPVEFLEGY